MKKRNKKKKDQLEKPLGENTVNPHFIDIIFNLGVDEYFLTLVFSK